MNNCIFSGHCLELRCDYSCPILAQSAHLMDINGLQLQNPALHATRQDYAKYSKIIAASEGDPVVLIDSKSTTHTADIITYTAICERWRGCQLHAWVYNLNFSQYVDLIQSSWGNSDSDKLEQIKQFIQSSKVLIISNIDYVNFKDFQSQLLLNLLESRVRSYDRSTIVVSPPISNLIGDGRMFSLLTTYLTKHKVKDK